MLDNLFDSIKGQVVESLTGEAGISAEQAEQVLPFAKESLTSGLMDQVKAGNTEGILGMFKSSGSGLLENSIFGGIKQNFISMITSKLGLSEGIAGMVANVGLSKIIGSISGQAKDDSGEISQDGLMSALGMGGGIGDIAKNMLKDKLGGLGGILGS